MQENREMIEILTEEEYVAPMGNVFDDFLGAGGGKGRNNCKTDCR